MSLKEQVEKQFKALDAENMLEGIRRVQRLITELARVGKSAPILEEWVEARLDRVQEVKNRGEAAINWTFVWKSLFTSGKAHIATQGVGGTLPMCRVWKDASAERHAETNACAVGVSSICGRCLTKKQAHDEAFMRSIALGFKTPAHLTEREDGDCVFQDIENVSHGIHGGFFHNPIDKGLLKLALFVEADGSYSVQRLGDVTNPTAIRHVIEVITGGREEWVFTAEGLSALEAQDYATNARTREARLV